MTPEELVERTRLDRRHNQLKTEKSYFVPQWMDLSKHISVRTSRFLVTDRQQQGAKRATDIINNTATLALRILASGMESAVTNPARSWLVYRMVDPDLGKLQSVKEWLDTARKITMETFLKSNLYSVLPLVYSDMGLYGTAAFSVEEDADSGIYCEHFPIGSFSIATNRKGRVDTCFRERQWTVGQMVDTFGAENCSDAVQRAYRDKKLDEWRDVVHVIEPNREWDERKLESKYKRFVSVYYEKGNTEKPHLSKKGFDEFPVMGPRWQTLGEDYYGTAPGWDAIGDTKTLQVMERRIMQALDKKITPPVTAPTSMKKKRISLLSGDVTYVDVANGANGITETYRVNLDITEVENKVRQIEERIRKAFYSDLFLMISSIDRSNVTAFEIAARKEEQLLALGPVYLRLNDELLDPLAERTFNILLRQGKFPPIPQEMQGKQIAIEYISVLSQTMKAVGVSAVERTMAFAGGMVQNYPQVSDKINADAAIDEYADMMGVPPRMINDEATAKKIRVERAKKDQAAQTMAMMNQGADTAQKLAGASMSDNNALSQIVQRLQGAQPPQGIPA